MARKKKSSPRFRHPWLALIAAFAAALFGVDLSGLIEAPTRTEPSAPAEGVALPRTPTSFAQAKRVLYDQIYAGRARTFYCGCDYDAEGKVDLASCGMQALAGQKRAQRVEAEHVFPAAQFGNFRACWREPASFPECRRDSGKALSGRQCCEKVDPVFRAAHNDLMNLFPAVGEVNGDRRDFGWGMVPNKRRGEYGACGIAIDPELRRAEPPDAVKGDVARTMLYMERTYGFRLSDQDHQLFDAWSRQDPPDAWEQERIRRIQRIQTAPPRLADR